MQNHFEKLFQEIKREFVFNSEDLEKLYFDIVERNRKFINQKKTQIERILGEITQLQAFDSTLLSALKSYVAKKRNIEADEIRTAELMEIKRRSAQERLQRALEDDGLDLAGRPVRQEILADNMEGDDGEDEGSEETERGEGSIYREDQEREGQVEEGQTKVSSDTTISGGGSSVERNKPVSVKRRRRKQ